MSFLNSSGVILFSLFAKDYRFHFEPAAQVHKNKKFQIARFSDIHPVLIRHYQTIFCCAINLPVKSLVGGRTATLCRASSATTISQSKLCHYIFNNFAPKEKASFKAAGCLVIASFSSICEKNNSAT